MSSLYSSSSVKPEGSLGKSYCIYFKFIYLLGVVLMVIIALLTGYNALTTNKPINYYLNMVLLWFTYFFIFLQNKLLYDMCQATLQ